MSAWTWFAFVMVIACEAVLLTAVVISILRPASRIWPPPGRGTWQYHVTWWPVLVGVPAGIALAWLDWNTFVWPAEERILVGGALIAFGLGLADWGVRTLGRPTSSGLGGPLQERGPYRWSRNPQYVGDILAVIGLGIVANSRLLWIGCLIGVVGLVLGPFAEEAWLRERYGAAFESYARRVPRFLGLAPPGRRQGESGDSSPVTR